MKQEEVYKNTDRSYAEINNGLKELEYRKNTIMKSVYELIED